MAGLTLLAGLLIVFVRPLGGALSPAKEPPRELSLLVEAQLGADLSQLEHATIHLPDLPLSAALKSQPEGLRCTIKSLKTPVSYQVTLYLAGGQQAIARGHLVERGPDLVAKVEDWRRLTPGGSELGRQAAARPVSTQWQRPEYVTPNAPWLGKLEVRRNLPRHFVASQPGGHHHQ